MRDTEQAEIMAPATITPGLRAIETPLVRATPESLAGYGQLVDRSGPSSHPDRAMAGQGLAPGR